MQEVEAISVMDLTKSYARHFAKDFTVNVMQHLGGSHPISEVGLESFIEPQLNEMQFDIGSSNTINRFLFECAQYAIEQNLEDKSSYAAWKSVSERPSIHHNEIQSLVYNSAGTYRNTVDKTVMGVIARDAYVAARSIAQAVQARTEQSETGGELITFSWGILNDGMWLNGALLKAYSLASIFHPDDAVKGDWAQIAFDYATSHATTLVLSDDQQMTCYGEIDMLIANSDADDMAHLLKTVSQTDINAMMFTVGNLSRQVAEWRHGMVDSTQLVHSVTQLTTTAHILNALSRTASSMDDGLISDLTKARIEQVYNVVVLSLAGYEALRSTKFADTLIMSVIGEGKDPKVNVIVNGDVAQTYYSSGGEQEDLIHFGLHLDPRRGMPPSSNGWSMSHIVNRRDQVIPQIMAESYDRLEQLRNNDAAVIQSETLKIVNGVVGSYLEARGLDTVRPDIYQRINLLSRQVSDASGEMKLDEEIIKILTAVLDDPFVTQMTDRLVTNMSSSDDFVRTHAQTLTIAQAALADANMYITDRGE